MLDSGAAGGFSLPHTSFDAAIVDLDGTMVDTLGDFVAAINLMLAELVPEAPPLGRAVVERMVGKGSEHLISSVLDYLAAQGVQQDFAINTEAKSSAASFDSAYASYQKHYAAINGRFAEVYAGVPEGLRGLQQAGYKLACLTNKPLVFAQALLRLKGLDGFFSAVFGGDSFERKKPDPLPLLKTCEALGVVPAKTLMIGDSSNDAQAARAAGCAVVLVTYGYNHGEPVQGVDADGFVDSLAELAIKLRRP
jgi:phosphoglycolate phosphatase